MRQAQMCAGRAIFVQTLMEGADLLDSASTFSFERERIYVSLGRLTMLPKSCHKSTTAVAVFLIVATMAQMGEAELCNKP